MNGTFTLAIYSTGGCFYKGECSHLIFNSVDGSRGVLPGHEPMLCASKKGEIRFLADGEWHNVVVTEGFVEIMPSYVRLFADTAVKADEVEEYRDRISKAHAAERERQRHSNQQFINTHLNLKRAMGRRH